MQTSLSRAFGALALFAAACGSKVVVDEPAASGAGGSTGSAATLHAATSTSTSTGAGTSVSASSVGSSSSGMTTCDLTGNCSICSSCAWAGPCADLAKTCLASTDCANLETCTNACSPDDKSCYGNCEALHQQGFPAFIKLGACVACGACFNDCSQLAGYFCGG